MSISTIAQVDQEDASGEYCEDFFRTNMTSAFRNMTNVIVYISPKGKENKKALLVNAHIDSAAGSTGCAHYTLVWGWCYGFSCPCVFIVGKLYFRLILC